MRALLIVNPYATATTPAGRDTLAHTLASRMELTVEQTTHRGHAEELAQRAVRDGGYDAIVVHGGDGSVNEVVNGLLGSPADARPAALPRLGIIPGGSANVFARALGIDADPLLATAQLIELLASGAQRMVNLGITDDRWFLFNCGMGVDARVIRAMEDKRNRGKAATPADTCSRRSSPSCATAPTSSVSRSWSPTATDPPGCCPASASPSCSTRRRGPTWAAGLSRPTRAPHCRAGWVFCLVDDECRPQPSAGDAPADPG